MSPVREYADKVERVHSLMESQGFNEEHIGAIVAGLRPGNVDSVLETLEGWEREDA